MFLKLWDRTSLICFALSNRHRYMHIPMRQLPFRLLSRYRSEHIHGRSNDWLHNLTDLSLSASLQTVHFEQK